MVPADDVPRSLAAIEGEATRLETLVADLLDLARLDAQRFDLDLASVEPAGVLDRAFDAMQAEALSREITFERGIDRLPETVTDESRVQRIVSNLLDNAIRWTPRGGTVRLEGHARADGGFSASVTDTGPGIPAGEQESIFEAFQSRETPTAAAAPASAWPSAAQLARALGGDVRVESQEGTGSTFVVEVPNRT